VLAVVRDVYNGHGVPVDELQAPRQPDERPIVRDRERAEIEENVVVRAQAQDVVGGVGTVMWPAQRPDVRRLGVRARRRLETIAAHLTAVVVEVLDPRADGAVPHDTLDRCWLTLRVLLSTRLRMRLRLTIPNQRYRQTRKADFPISLQ
jgi:hypothetical protein